MRNLDDLFSALSQSKFRRRFRLGEQDRRYLHENGLSTVIAHARDFIQLRLAPADPPNDGRQTPMRGHPIFVAQHATATCCRSCLAKWHRISKNAVLTAEEIEYVVGVLQTWLERQSRPTTAEEKVLDVRPKRQRPSQEQRTLL
jgi:Domain of unknown function (DUF4186)